MDFPLSTGRAAALLGVSEPQLAEQVRRGRIRPSPPIFAGRRMWQARHLIQAAQALGVAVPDTEGLIEAGLPDGDQ